MIFYFSGTGNSQLAARQIAKMTEDKVVSINQCLKKGENGTYHSEHPFVFVAPTYGWRMPRVAEQWIRSNRFEGNPKAYFVLTCGDSCGNAAAYAKKLCIETGLHFCGLAPVVMPENYVAMFATPKEAECRAIIKKAEPCIAAIARTIGEGKPLDPISVSIVGKLQSSLVNQIYYPLLVRDKGFKVSSACVSCNKCVERCPLHNIGLVHGKPVWNGNCTHCMACIGGCPTEAIDYKSASKGKRRYYIMDDAGPERNP